jgi:hypothetical protein
LYICVGNANQAMLKATQLATRLEGCEIRNELMKLNPAYRLRLTPDLWGELIAS